jgi:hypothetical protein
MSALNIEAILTALNNGSVRYMLIGGANFMIRHAPLLTYDVDVWVDDNEENLARLGKMLHTLKAEWGPTEQTWQVVPADWKWLMRQAVFCMTTPIGALDVFREVRGLEQQFEACYARSASVTLPSGITFRALSDEDMLQSQLALSPHEQNQVKIETLKRAIANGNRSQAT